MTPPERGPEWRALAQQERFKWAANERADKAERDLGEALALLDEARETVVAYYNAVAKTPPDDADWVLRLEHCQMAGAKLLQPLRAFLAAHPAPQGEVERPDTGKHGLP